MAKFIYRMQSILDIKMKMETQAKQEFAQAKLALDREEETMERLKKRRQEYEEEAKRLTLMSAEESLHYIADKVDIAVVKVGKKGSLIKRGEEVVSIGCNDVKVVDTTGAGDMYAAGFLYGLINGYDLQRCGKIGNLLAENIIQYIGAKMDESGWSTFMESIKE